MTRLQLFRWPRQRWLLLSTVALAALISVSILYCRFLGYPDGSIFRVVPASTPVPAHNKGTAMLFLSGDMGFNAGMGPRIAEEMAHKGIAVVGINSLAAFSSRGTADDAVRIVEKGLQRTLALPGTERVVLVGQSFGSNILLAAASGLPQSYRNRVPGLILIVPGDTMFFRATPGGIFDIGDDGPALPYARAMNWAPVLCIHGQREANSLCPVWQQANVRSVSLPGGHFLNDNVKRVTDTIDRNLIGRTSP